jgi:NADPH:quinone reductase-like Zn-dependent oxidoreductase
LGADETVDRRADPEWHLAVRKLTGGVGVDLTLEIGGAETSERSLEATQLGGRVALVGLITGRANASLLAAQGKEITPVRVGSRQDFEDMNRAIAFHKVRPIIDTRYKFEQLPDALRHLAGGRHLGKIVIGLGG